MKARLRWKGVSSTRGDRSSVDRDEALADEVSSARGTRSSVYGGEAPVEGGEFY